jgi:glutamate-1-semialdehyde 2,1-aminomutase
MAQAPAVTIQQEFQEQFAGSMAMHQRARQAIAGGINHDGRYAKPFPPYILRGDGAYKWDVDGHKLIDYVVGHGALILGHNDPDVTAAMHQALGVGTHLGAGHEGEIVWAEQVKKLVPGVDLVKMTGSGTESTLLAMRIARSFTGKTKIVKFEGHFHGWNDYALKGEKPPFDTTVYPGIPAEVMTTMDVVKANDLAVLEARLRQGDVAAVLMEPSGAAWAMVPLVEGFLQGARDLATRYGAVLIFDEVITGFRYAPGGAQERYGVQADLATYAKVIAGGMPGGAVAGHGDVMEVLAFRDDDPQWNTTRKVRHQGTFNAQPVAAAAGATCLRKLEGGAVNRRADELASRLRAGFNTVLEERGLPGFAWGESSLFHLALGLDARNRAAADLHNPEGPTPTELKASPAHPRNAVLYQGMMLEGIELFHSGGLLTVAHTEDDIDQTVAAFNRVLARMEAEGAYN